MQMRHKKEEARCTKAHSAFNDADEMACCLWRVIGWDEIQDGNRHSLGKDRRKKWNLRMLFTEKRS